MISKQDAGWSVCVSSSDRASVMLFASTALLMCFFKQLIVAGTETVKSTVAKMLDNISVRNQKDLNLIGPISTKYSS